MSEFVSRNGPFIIDNSGDDRKVVHHLRDWCVPGTQLDVATGTFEIGGLLSLRDEWPRTKSIRILMGTEVSLRTKAAFERALSQLTQTLDRSLEDQKRRDDFLEGVDAVVEAMKSGKITCRVYTRDKFHAKAYIARSDEKTVAMAGSSNFSVPGLTENVELNTAHAGADAAELVKWFDQHWDLAVDVTAEMLQTVERHVQLFKPFDVYAKSLQELFLGQEMSATEWEKGTGAKKSQMYPRLDPYQQDGYHQLLKISETFRGAFLCDGVGLGKTFMGLMLIERLIYENQTVVLLVPKAARGPVWEAALRRYMPDLFSRRSRLWIYNHTDLIRGESGDRNFPAEFEEVAREAGAFVIDEAHHFRNPGVAGEGESHPSRYRHLFEICGGKKMFLLTATPVNNRLIDLQHMIELFSCKEADYFFKLDPTLGIHSIPGHFRKMEKELEKLVATGSDAALDEMTTDAVEAEKVLSDDRLFRKIVVQRSRGYVRKAHDLRAKGNKSPPITRPPKELGIYIFHSSSADSNSFAPADSSSS